MNPPNQKQPKPFADIEFEDWPEKTYRNGRPFIPTTIKNTNLMLDMNAVELRFSKLTKEIEVNFDSKSFCSELAANAELAFVISMAAYYGFNVNLVERYITAIAAENSYCPVTDWLDSREWDGKIVFPSS